MTAADVALFDVPEEWWRRRRCRVCGGALSVVHGYTYVVQRQWWVKVGATNKPRRRLGELARPAWIKHLLSPPGMDWTEPLEVLAVVGGDVEHDLHAELAGAHVVGEWFERTPVLEAWLADLA